MIKIKVGENSPFDADDLDEEGEPVASISMDMRRDVSGNFMIFDHGDIDIIVKPKESKIVMFGKEEVRNTDTVYDAQNRLIRFLTKKGIVNPETARGGSFLGSMECAYYADESNSDIDPIQIALFGVGKFIEEERPFYMFRKAYEEEELERLYNPDDEYSTELGEVPHAEEKGSIPARINNWGANYGVYEEEKKK